MALPEPPFPILDEPTQRSAGSYYLPLPEWNRAVALAQWLADEDAISPLKRRIASYEREGGIVPRDGKFYGRYKSMLAPELTADSIARYQRGRAVPTKPPFDGPRFEKSLREGLRRRDLSEDRRAYLKRWLSNMILKNRVDCVKAAREAATCDQGSLALLSLSRERARGRPAHVQ